MNSWTSWPRISIALALAGIGVTAYLSYVSFNSEALSCAIGDCGTVQSSDYAKIAGIPIALLGLGMYLVVLGLAVLRLNRPEHGEMATFGIFALVASSTFYYAYLTYIELFVLEAICQWCVLSALLTIGLLVSESVQSGRLLRA